MLRGHVVVPSLVPVPSALGGEAQATAREAALSQRSPRSVGFASRRRSARPSALGNGYALNPIIIIIIIIIIIRRPLGHRRCEVDLDLRSSVSGLELQL